MGICIYCDDKSADTLYLENGANRFVQEVECISVAGFPGRLPGSRRTSIHRLPDGVRTNGFVIEVPQIPIIMLHLCHNYVIIMVYCSTSAKKTFVLTPFGTR